MQVRVDVDDRRQARGFEPVAQSATRLRAVERDAELAVPVRQVVPAGGTASVELTDDAAGFITLENGETIDFSNIEQIGF